MTHESKTMRENTAWHLDRKVPISLIVAIIVQSAGAIWWASSIESRMQNVAQSDVSQSARIGQVEASVQTQGDGDALALFAGDLLGDAALATDLAKVKQWLAGRYDIAA